MSDALADAFAPLEVCRDGASTSLVGEVEDQSAFYGLLNRIQAFGLELAEVRYSSVAETSAAETSGRDDSRRADITPE